MVKVKIFGVIRSTTGFGYLEVEAKSVKDIFDEISKKMEKGYKEDKEKLEFKDAVVYVNGERCMRKGKKLKAGDEVWLLSPAAGG